MKILTAIMVLALTASISDAKPKHWYTDKKWWIGTAVIGAAMAADAHSTSRAIGQGLSEDNPFLGEHPSNHRIALWMFSGFCFQTGLHAAAWHVERDETNKYWNVAKYVAIPSSVAIINGHAAAHNYSLEH